jgi:hypothetical protein
MLITDEVKMTGMNNRARADAVPDGMARNAVNVQFDNSGRVIIPRVGRTRIYTGNTHSVVERDTGVFFVEDGNLKQLLGPNNAVTLKTGVGDDHLVYTKMIGQSVYFSSKLSSGEIRNGKVYPWPIACPPVQPTCRAMPYGDMFAGDYQVAITWVVDGPESGTGESAIVSVPEGGGIQLTGFPTPPDYVTEIAVYVSQVNGEVPYLYGEFPADTTQVFIDKYLSDVALETQFMVAPKPEDVMTEHNGVIYYAKGPYVFRTEPHLFHLQSVNKFWAYDSDVQTIVETPSALYIGTETMIYKVTDLNGDDFAHNEPLQDVGTVKGSEYYDPDGSAAYFMSKRGYIKATPEKLEELTYEQCAIPFFKHGTVTVSEYNGLKYLIGVFQDGEQNPLANTQYSADELLRGTL